jgi:hypothetical protein
METTATVDFNKENSNINYSSSRLSFSMPVTTSMSCSVSSPSKKEVEVSNKPPSIPASITEKRTVDYKNLRQVIDESDLEDSMESFEDAEEGDENDTAFLPSAMKEQLYASVQQHRSDEPAASFPFMSKLDFSISNFNGCVKDPTVCKAEEAEEFTQTNLRSDGTALHRPSNTHEGNTSEMITECNARQVQNDSKENIACQKSEVDECRSINEGETDGVDVCQLILPSDLTHENVATTNEARELAAEVLVPKAAAVVTYKNTKEIESVATASPYAKASCNNSQFTMKRLLSSDCTKNGCSSERHNSKGICGKEIPWSVTEGPANKLQFDQSSSLILENAAERGEFSRTTHEETASLTTSSTTRAAHSSLEGHNEQAFTSHNSKILCDHEASVNVALDLPAALADAEEKISRLTMERDALSSLYKQMNAQNLHEMQALRKQLEEKITEQHMAMEQQCKERESQAKQMVTDKLTAEYSGKIALLQDQLLEEKERHKAQLKRLDDEHRSEIDELIQQLDDVELEQESKGKELHQRINEKETIISVLSSQLVEANALARRMEQKRIVDEEQISTAKEELSSCRQEIMSLQKQIETIKVEHAEALDNELIKRRKAVQLATDDVRAAAEAQFTEANKHYLRLRHEYDRANTELKKLKDLHDSFVKDAKANEVAMLASLTKLKAELASAEARIAEVTQRYSIELENIRLADRALRTQLEEAQKNYASAQSSLAHMVRENEELRKISEELMAMVEGNQTV